MLFAKRARWLLLSARILLRAHGRANRWRTLHCLLRSIAAHLGVRLSPKTFRLILDGNVYFVESTRRDLTPYATVWIEKEYEPDARFAPRPGGVVVDVGAQVGFLAIRAARAVGHGRVLAIEPDPRSFDNLTRNLAANRVTNVTPIHCALSNVEGVFPFVSAAHSVDSRILTPGVVGPRLQRQSGACTVDIPCTTLDRLTQRESVQAIDLLKIDVEGMEEKILRAAPETLSRVRAAIIEIHDPRTVHAIESVLSNAGLRPAFRRGGVHGFLRS